MTALPSEWDLLEHVEIVVPCNVCQTTYGVPVSLVRDSQRLVAEGCTGSGVHACDAAFYAGLLAPEAIDRLADAWDAFQRSAAQHGGLGVDLRATAAPHELAIFDLCALHRWEDEGGSCVGVSIH